jgi:biopolymer transport protein ExbD
MAISTGGDAEAPMSDINTTPLVDVMLVLLIIFLIAIPVAVQSVEIKLPKVSYEATETKPENLVLTVRGNESGCEVYWGMTPVTSAELFEQGKIKLEAEIEKQGGINAAKLEIPEVHIRGDINTPYRCIGATIFTMQSVGYAKVGFISEPPPNSQL